MKWFTRIVLWSSVWGCLGGTSSVLGQDQEAAWFETRIRPVLATKCVQCHGPDKQEGGLRLDARAALLNGGDSGPAVVPGDAEGSLLLSALRYESLEMPPAGPLDESIVANFATWIQRGLVWPDSTGSIRAESGRILAEDRQWWAFQPVSDPPLPPRRFDARHPVDRFVFHRLAQRGLVPAARAAKRVLVRRLYFDLLGVPPTPAEIERYVADQRPDAWLRLVDQLLADPRYGQHWARHWLDVVRYAESDGWNQDAYREPMYHYRDYVVRSLNADVSYRRFVRQQLAGDELPGDDPDDLAATSFLRLGIYEYNQRDARSHWNDIINEITDVTGDAFLGIGMACARCHDHKFDPILQRDYFQLRAFFEPLVWRDDQVYATADEQRAHEQALERWNAATAEVRAEIDTLLEPYYARKWRMTVDKFPFDIQACFHKPVAQRTSREHQMAYLVGRQFWEEGGGPLKLLSKEDQQRYDALQAKLEEFASLRPNPLPALMTAADFSGAISPTTIPDRADEVAIPPGFLTVLDHVVPAIPKVQPRGESTGRRTALALWITDDRNPLTSRVIVNRIWQYHFGRGLCDTANDFGRRGSGASHPQLLDWLTRRFVESDWHLKSLHRLIVTSETWQMSAFHELEDQQQALDPQEQLIWRARVRRLSAEQIRDAMLSIAAQLDPRLGGPSEDGTTRRRALYLKSRRNTPDAMLGAFDAANGLKSVSDRGSTTTPLQALLMINGEFSLQAARHWAEQLQQSAGGTDRSCRHAVRTACSQAWGRAPTDAELDRALRFLAVDESQPYNAADSTRWIDFCHVLLNSNEFLYVD